MLDLLAQVNATQPNVQAPPFVQMIMQNAPAIFIGLILLYLFSLSSGPKRKAEKARKSMLEELKKGDRVQTIGGILGTVVNADATEITLKVDETSNTKMRFIRSAIHAVITDEKADAK